MECQFCHKDIGERDRFTLLEGCPYHDDCYDYLRGGEEIGRGERPERSDSSSSSSNTKRGT